MEKPNFPGQNIQAKIDQEVPFLVWMWKYTKRDNRYSEGFRTFPQFI
jgi:hypothetical protein